MHNGLEDIQDMGGEPVAQTPIMEQVSRVELRRKVGRSLLAVRESSNTLAGGRLMSVRWRDRKSWIEGRCICRREREN